MPRPRTALVLLLLALPPAATAQETPVNRPNPRSFRVDLPPPPSLPALAGSIASLATLDVESTVEPSGSASPPDGPWNEERCATWATELTAACRADDMEACASFHASSDSTPPHPCSGRFLVPDDLPPAEAVALRRCLGDRPRSCAEVADALDDDGSIVHFRLKTRLFVRGCESGNATACDGLASLVEQEPFRVLEDALARAPKLRGCRLRGGAQSTCEKSHPERRRPRPPAPSQAALALERAVHAGQFADIRRLAVKPALADGTDSQGIPLLFVAIRREDPRTALALLKAGAKPSATFDGVPALTAALHHGLPEVASLLLDRKAPHTPTVPTPVLLPIHAAVDGGASNLVARLVAAGAVAPRDLLLRSVDQADLGALLSLLPKKPDATILAELLARAVLVDETTALALLGRGASARSVPRPLVRFALDRGDLGLARALVEAGGDATTARGEWPLVPAAALGETTLIRAMVRQGARVEAGDPRTGTTALAAAVQGGHVETLEFLLDRGAPTGVTLRDGEPVLLFAMRTGQAAVVRMLLAARAEVNIEWKGVNGLHIAAGRNEPSLVEALLAAGARVDVPLPVTGATPLHLAAEVGDVATLRLLLAAGADRSRVTADGRTAHAIALAGGHASAAELLVTPESKPKQPEP